MNNTYHIVWPCIYVIIMGAVLRRLLVLLVYGTRMLCYLWMLCASVG